ncbi:uncharacterized protein [Osmerus mordax]|uniref:uncharacterized protein isoform X2 n=1 Tax=Osmerus mordax TaxID=8014 RepID=UPI00350FBBBC
MATSVRWSRGRLLQSEVVDEMLLLSELIREANDQQQQRVAPGFTVPRMGGQTGIRRIRMGFIRHESLHRQGICFGWKIAEIMGVSRRTVNRRLRWRIVIHGGIDGFSRLVVFLKASNNNRSDIVMDLFSEAVAQFGVPSRVRCDYGGENNAICLFMDVFRRSTRGSIINALKDCGAMSGEA